jgi:hypothetical protein
MSAEAAEASTFSPEHPDELASVVGFLATLNASVERRHRPVTPLWRSVNMTVLSCRVHCTKP